MTIWKYQKTILKIFLLSALFLFRPLFPKYQHFLALKAYISEMRAEIETVEVAWALLFDYALFSMSFKFFFAIWTFGFWPLPQKSCSHSILRKYLSIHPSVSIPTWHLWILENDDVEPRPATCYYVIICPDDSNDKIIDNKLLWNHKFPPRIQPNYPPCTATGVLFCFIGGPCAAHLPLNSLSCSTFFSSNTNKNTNKKKINNNPINIYIPRFLQEPTNNTIAVQLYTPPLAWMLIKFNICSKISCHVFSEFYNTSTLHTVS